MTTLNISLPDNMKTWINQRVTGGDYSNISDYIRSLIRRDPRAITSPTGAG